jgi:hypothetical protein
MPTIEELEHPPQRGSLALLPYTKERLDFIAQGLAEILAKTEKNTAEIGAVKERLNSLAQRLNQLYERTERDKTEILTKTERDKREIIYWMAGLLVGFATLLITAMWALLSFAIKP